MATPKKSAKKRPSRERIRDAAAAAAVASPDPGVPTPAQHWEEVARRFERNAEKAAGRADEKEIEVVGLLTLIAIATRHGYLKDLSTSMTMTSTPDRFGS